MTAAVPDPRFRDQLAEGHEHDWTDWVRPAVLRDSFGVVIDSAGVGIRRVTGADQPVTPAWWRTCRTCPSEESAFPAAEEAVLRVEALIAVAPVMWHGDYPVKAVPVSDLLSALAAPVPHDADGGERR